MNKPVSEQKIYECWHHLKQRCNGTSNKDVNLRYQGRGISYDPKWETFAGFEEDMYQSYLEAGGDNTKLHLDRIDNDGNYCASNCRWVDAKVNQNNKRTNVHIRGKTISQWCDHFGFSQKQRNRTYKRWKTYKVRDFDTLFGEEYVMQVRTKQRLSLPCVNCGKTGGTTRKENGLPVRKLGMCNTCYCHAYKQKKERK